MIVACLVLAAQGAAVETVLKTSTLDAAVFRPGLVFIVREAAIPVGTGLYRLDKIPQALDGTLWCDSPDGAKVSELRTTIDLKATIEEREPKSVAELLSVSVGKPMELTIQEDKVREKLSATLLSISPDQLAVTLRLSNGALRQVARANIVEALTPGKVPFVQTQVPRVDLRFRAYASRPSRIRMTSLEFGAAWVSNYRLQLDGNSGVLDAAAQLGLSNLGLDSTRVKLVSGLPNLSTNSKLDLAVGAASLSGYLEGATESIGTVGVDPFVSAENLLQRVPVQLRGGQGLVPQSIDYIAYDPSDNSLVTRGSQDSLLPQFIQKAINASRNEDLHVYDFGEVSLPPGGRITRTLSSSKVSTKTVYHWDVKSGNGFARLLLVHNGTGSPWPSGQILLQSGGLPLAQVPMPFTGINSDASLDLGVAEDVLHYQETNELSRRTLPPQNKVSLIESTNEAVLTITNTRSSPVEIEIVDEINGTIVDHPGATVVQRLQPGLQNPVSLVTWRFKLAPGEFRTERTKFLIVLS